MIRTKNVTKIYKNGFKAVDNLNLEIDEGDIFGFLGPNGAGKTTTIRMLDGLLEPTSGEVLIGGLNIKDHPLEIKKMVGVVPESHGYYYWMSAKEFLQYFNSLFNNNENNDEYVDYLLKKVGLYEKRNVPVGQFSRGMKQRLGIAKSLINKPKIIFLDEPTLGLDPKGQKEIQQLILDINKQDHITVFITSHLLKDIEVLCNKVCIIKNGCLIEQGTIKDLQKKYLTHYVLELETSDNALAYQIIGNVKELKVSAQEDHLEVLFDENLSEENIKTINHQLVGLLIENNIDIQSMSKKTLNMEDIFFKAIENDLVKGESKSYE